MTSILSSIFYISSMRKTSQELNSETVIMSQELNSETVIENIVTIHSVLCIYCTVREKVIQECINPIAAGDFKWIYAGYWSRSEPMSLT